MHVSAISENTHTLTLAHTYVRHINMDLNGVGFGWKRIWTCIADEEKRISSAAMRDLHMNHVGDIFIPDAMLALDICVCE